MVGELPALRKAVYIAASHTSNWDGFWLIIAKIILRADARFLAKHTLFWWPLGPILTALGAIPVERGRSRSTVRQIVDRFSNDDDLLLALAPEGTRGWQPHWRSGFYRIASAADVPIVLAFIDYSKKEMGIGITLQPGGDIKRDMVRIRQFYSQFEPRHRHLQGPMILPPGDTTTAH